MTTQFQGIDTLKSGDRVELSSGKEAVIITVHASYVVARRDGSKLNVRVWPENIRRQVAA